MLKKTTHIILLLAILGIGCHSKPEPKAKIRGKIINPRTGEVVVSRDFLLLDSDTLQLHNQNELSGTVKAPVEGLYVIFIFPEFQTVYLKPGDSLAVHLNVDEFDESISFSGSLAFENNLLMEMFLANERENDYFYNNRFNFNLETFNQKLDSFEVVKNQIIENHKEDYRTTSEKYKQILSLYKKSAFCNLKENYALRHLNDSFPKKYFVYRKVLHKNIPDPNIIYLNAFADAFLEFSMKKNCVRDKNPYLNLSNLIDNEITDPAFKDNLLVKYCIRYINTYHIYKKDSVVTDFYGKIKNIMYQNFCDKIISNNNLVRTGNKFPESVYLTPEKNQISTDSLFKPGIKTMLIFWDFRFRKNFMSNLKKIKTFQEQNPGLQFVIINTNTGEIDEWLLQIPKDSNIVFVQALNKTLIHKITPYSPAQVYLLDGQTIKASKINMYKPGFERKLKELLDENQRK